MVLDRATHAARSVLGHLSLGTIEERLGEAVEALHRTAEATERSVESAEKVAEALPALTEAVTRLCDQLADLLELAKPAEAVEREVRTGFRLLFGRRKH